MDNIRKNAEQYNDPTAYIAISRVMKGERSMGIFKGDIYKVMTGTDTVREVVILSAHEKISTVLMLSDDERLPIQVLSKKRMYTDPAMVQYVFNDRLCGFIKTLSMKDADALVQAVVDSLGFNQQVPVSKDEKVDHPAHYQGKNECIDVMTAMFGKEAVKAFCKCNAYKYRFRAAMKNGAEDIKKAEWYETELINLESN